MSHQKLKQAIKADANPEKLVAAIQRRDKSYIRGALQWYERKQPKGCLTTFLKQVYGSC
jgi:hypothetical protein